MMELVGHFFEAPSCQSRRHEMLKSAVRSLAFRRKRSAWRNGPASDASA